MYNPYKVLGVDSTLPKSKIKSRYKELSKKYHPDNQVTGDTKTFQEINKAWKYIENSSEIKSFTTNKGFWKHKTLFSIYKEDVE